MLASLGLAAFDHLVDALDDGGFLRRLLDA